MKEGGRGKWLVGRGEVVVGMGEEGGVMGERGNGEVDGFLCVVVVIVIKGVEKGWGFDG